MPKKGRRVAAQYNPGKDTSASKKISTIVIDADYKTRSASNRKRKHSTVDFQVESDEVIEAMVVPKKKRKTSGQRILGGKVQVPKVTSEEVVVK